MIARVRTIAVVLAVATTTLAACTFTAPGSRVAGPAVGVVPSADACSAAEIGSGAPVRYLGLTTPFNDEPLSTCRPE
jgi:hypothetical protein